jgi:hypothetical protein
LKKILRLSLLMLKRMLILNYWHENDLKTSITHL